MKIGIMTFWWSNDNYGQLLQCYALQKYLRDRGHDAFLIRYKPDNYKKISFSQKVCFTIKHPFQTLTALYKKIKPITVLSELEKIGNEKRDFDAFRNSYIITSECFYKSYDELVSNPPEADMYIVGSDQIWNINNEYAFDVINAWFLNFAPEKVIRTSYSASFGRNNLSTPVRKRIKPLLEKFSSVTVRENSGKNICNKMRINSEVVCDPTLLLSVGAYRKLFVPIKITKNYVFCYMLSNTCTFSVRKLSRWAKDNHLEIIYVTGNVGWLSCDYEDEEIEKSYLTIPEWLSYLANAEYVITNSFHCSLFSLFFEKKVAIVPLNGAVKNTNNRIDSLFSNLGVKKTSINKNNFEVLKSLRSQKINADFIERSKNILNSFEVKNV